MNTKVKTILQQLLQSPRRFPVELALGVVFFIIAVWDSETHVWNEKTAEYVSAVNGDILWFFVPLMALTFWLHRVNRWAYYASFFLFLPLMMLDLKPFLWTYGFAFTYVLAFPASSIWQYWPSWPPSSISSASTNPSISMSISHSSSSLCWLRKCAAPLSARTRMR